MMIADLVINCIGSSPNSLSKLEPTNKQSNQGGLTPECYGS